MRSHHHTVDLTVSNERNESEGLKAKTKNETERR